MLFKKSNDKKELLIAIFGADNVVEEVLLSHTRPTTYIKENSQRLLQRGITKPVNNLFWIALTNALKDRSQLAELDWKDTTASLFDAISNLTIKNDNHNAIVSDLDSAGFDWDEPAYESLEQFAAVLKKYSLSLMMIEIGSDSLPLFIGDTATRDEILSRQTKDANIALISS